MPKLSIRDLDLQGKRVFIRVDFNVPLKNGVIGDDTRISRRCRRSLCAREGATVVLARHLGRPKGKAKREFSLRPVAAHLSQILGAVVFADDCVGEKAVAAVISANRRSRRPPGEPALSRRERKKRPRVRKALASLADEYVNDAFGAAHRAHASVEAITRFVPRARPVCVMEEELAISETRWNRRTGRSSRFSAARKCPTRSR